MENLFITSARMKKLGFIRKILRTIAPNCPSLEGPKLLTFFNEHCFFSPMQSALSKKKLHTRKSYTNLENFHLPNFLEMRNPQCPRKIASICYHSVNKDISGTTQVLQNKKNLTIYICDKNFTEVAFVFTEI